MRLKKYEVKAIKDTYTKVFSNGLIYLFGSRADDSKKGGDIDLFLVPDEDLSTSEAFDKKSQFRLQLIEKIGEQKIDVIVSKDQKRSIEQEALRTGILL